MIKKQHFLILLTLLYSTLSSAQNQIKDENIDTLNRIADEYDDWKWIAGILTTVLAVTTIWWNFWGVKSFLKRKVEEWIVEKISKDATITMDNIKAAVQEFEQINRLKQKKVVVISPTEGQQDNVKRVFDRCGFNYDENSWVSINNVQSLVLGKVDALLFNDQTDIELTDGQIESVMEKFKTNVGYFYLGDKRLKSDEYRRKYKIDLDFCNSITRLESGLLSLLKIR